MTAGRPDRLELAARLSAALDAGTRDSFTALLTEDVRWGMADHFPDCTTKAEAGASYERLLAAGTTMQLLHVGEPDDDHVTVTLRVDSGDTDAEPAEVSFRCTLRDGLIARIGQLEAPPSLEVLYFNGCPHVEPFLAHLRHLLDEHRLSTTLTTTLVGTEADAQAHRFLGSPTLRVEGVDVEPGAAGRDDYALQCRLYPTPDGGTAGAPPDEWILDRLLPDAKYDAAVDAIHAGDTGTLQRLLAEHPDVATTRLPRHGGRTLLHVATDWPGHFPNVAATVSTLLDAGADPNTPALGDHAETPLHWAASSNDVAALDALIDGGADIHAPGAVIGGGTPMADATAFGQWDAARRLLERGSRTTLFEAATLGLTDRVRDHLEHDRPAVDDVTAALWAACHGGRRDTAELLLDRGADLDWVGWDGLTPLDAADRSEAAELVTWLRSRGARSASG